MWIYYITFLLISSSRRAAHLAPPGPTCRPHLLPRPRPRPASSVYRLAPHNIGLVAALGDSIVAGMGANASNLVEILHEYRGASFLTGLDPGQQSLIRLIHQFNPRVLGGSRGHFQVWGQEKEKENDGRAGLNLSVTAATTLDLIKQARRLVEKVTSIPGWKHKWKLVGIMIGHNDLCIWSCNSLLTPLAARARVSQQDYENNIRRTVEYLRRLPRTLVILLDPCDVTLVMKGTDKPPRCKLTHMSFCPCLFGPAARPNKVSQLYSGYKAALARVAADPALRSPLFAAVHLASLDLSSLPLEWERLALDCYHFTSQLHARAAVNIWNNLLQDQDQRTIDYAEDPPSLLCPSPRNPFFHIDPVSRSYS